LIPQQIRMRDYPSVITGNWNIPFPYLPSAVAMMLPLSLLPQTIAFIFWILLQAIAFAVVLWTSMHMAGIAADRRRLLILAAAVVIVSSPIQWDFRTHNNNLIYLALILLGLKSQRLWLSAILFAITANLKLYSVALIPGFLWRREYRIAAATAIATLTIAVVLPLLAFGYSHSTKLLGSWINEILFTMSPAGQAGAPLSLSKTAAALLGLEPAAFAVTVAARSAQAVWLGIVACYFLIAAKRDAPSSRSTSARLCDVVVMLMLPLPLSSWLVTYHAIVMSPAFVLIVAKLVEWEAPRGVRVMAAIAGAGCVVLRVAFPEFVLRAGVYYLSFVLVVLALGAIRMSLDRTSSTTTPIQAASP
ncbi:MAG TPA: glycosyltransferase family 87 protein, partial [Pseudorhodoplanes sp.]|nr:glycosyltransferase family 87 protein [Pseudorhodoplanes sp.]